MNYEQKYLKYKQKYVSLKKMNIGGNLEYINMVKKNGLSIKDVPEDKINHELVMDAVQQNELALQYVPVTLLNVDVFYMALKKNNIYSKENDYMNYLKDNLIKFNEIFENIKEQLEKLPGIKGSEDGSSHWTNECTISTFGISCGNILSEYLTQECSSTEYMLDIIQKSIIGNKNYINIKFDEEKFKKDGKTLLTNKWKDDLEYFNIVYDPDFIENYQKYQENPKGRLIMGFGPSASGKTFISETIIRIFSKASSNKFPPSFLTIDGGVHRKYSMVYRYIVNILPKIKKGIVGLINLINPGITGNEIFKYNVKKELLKYLELQKLKTGIKLNLYIPETLSGCQTLRYITVGSCLQKYDKYINYTEDTEWIGLNIWQHKTGSKCDKNKEYKCIGCKESGESRQVEEGKIYSNSNWQRSFDHSHHMMLTAPGGKYEIHNSGGQKYTDGNGKEEYCKSIFEIFSRPITTELREELVKNNFHVLSNK